jgi:hypothetical protein
MPASPSRMRPDARPSPLCLGLHFLRDHEDADVIAQEGEGPQEKRITAYHCLIRAEPEDQPITTPLSLGERRYVFLTDVLEATGVLVEAESNTGTSHRLEAGVEYLPQALDIAQAAVGRELISHAVPLRLQRAFKSLLRRDCRDDRGDDYGKCADRYWMIVAVVSGSASCMHRDSGLAVGRIRATRSRARTPGALQLRCS